MNPTISVDWGEKTGRGRGLFEVCVMPVKDEPFV